MRGSHGKIGLFVCLGTLKDSVFCTLKDCVCRPSLTTDQPWKRVGRGEGGASDPPQSPPNDPP